MTYTYISELIDLLYSGLFCVHEEVEDEVKRFHEEKDYPANSFLLYEFFLHQPLHVTSPSSGELLEQCTEYLFEEYKEIRKISSLIEVEGNKEHKTVHPLLESCQTRLQERVTKLCNTQRKKLIENLLNTTAGILSECINELDTDVNKQVQEYLRTNVRESAKLLDFWESLLLTREETKGTSEQSNREEEDKRKLENLNKEAINVLNEKLKRFSDNVKTKVTSISLPSIEDIKALGIEERGEKKDSAWLLAPFLGKAISSVKPTSLSEKPTDIIIRLEDSFWMRHLHKWWNYGLFPTGQIDVSDNKDKVNKTTLSIFQLAGQGARRKPFFADIVGLTVKFLNPSERMVSNVSPEELLSVASLKEIHQLINAYFADLSGSDGICSFLIPIASTTVFYGELFVVVPNLKEKEERKALGERLVSYVSKRYVPALTLLHEHFYEKNCGDISKIIKEGLKPPSGVNLYLTHSDKREFAVLYRNPFCPPSIQEDKSSAIQSNSPGNVEFSDNLPEGGSRQTVPGDFCKNCAHFDWHKYSDNVMEVQLHHMWIKILHKYITNGQEALIFKKFIATSPRMIALFKDIFEVAKGLKMMEDNSLPCVLVIGGPGSGKNSIPKLLKMFSHYYRNGGTYFLNVASIKPNAVLGPALVGLDAKIESEVSYLQPPSPPSPSPSPSPVTTAKSLYLSGILEKIRKETLQAYKDTTDKDPIKKWKEDKGCLPTLVLDEFNSLDIEFQGILLRFLENAEIVSIGGTKDVGLQKGDPAKREPDADFMKEMTDFLIVGVMNEDPEELTRERAVELMKREEYLKGLLSDVLQEYILKIRRLRPDLKARMLRNGKFRIPELEERRDDIPLLFHFFLSLEISNYLENERRLESLSRNEFSRHPHHELEEGLKTLKERPKWLFRAFITQEAMETLVSEELDWPGNVRQLQTLSKRVAVYVCEQYRQHLEREGLPTILIKKRHIRRAMADIGMWIQERPTEKQD